MKRKNVIITVSVLLIIFISGIVGGTALLSLNSAGISSGYFLEADNGTCFLITGNTPVRLHSDHPDRISGYETGDKILVLHGGIAESYPASALAKFIIKTGKGAPEDIPSDVIKSLTQLGWLTAQPQQGTEYEFSARYVKTGCPSQESLSFPMVSIISAEEALQDYIRDNGEKYALNDDFYSECEKYDEEYFSKNSLVLIYLSEGSGSISHKVTGVSADGEDTLSVYIERDVPEVGTCDMAYHHIFVSLEKEALTQRGVVLFVDKRNVSEKWQDVTLSSEYANFTLSLPEDFSYTENEYREDSKSFGISIFHKDAPESTITVEFLSAFGVCGTGLSSSDITIGGYNAVKGVYDGNPTWDFIHISDTPGEYVIYNHCDAGWWQTYGKKAEMILDTLKIAEGIVFRNEALLIAEKNAEGEYKRTYGEFDIEKGVWEFTFIKDQTEYHARVSATGELL